MLYFCNILENKLIILNISINSRKLVLFYNRKFCSRNCWKTKTKMVRWWFSNASIPNNNFDNYFTYWRSSRFIPNFDRGETMKITELYIYLLLAVVLFTTAAFAATGEYILASLIFLGNALPGYLTTKSLLEKNGY